MVPHSGSLTEAISAAMVELYGRVYGHDRTIATTYINDDVVVCILERILTTEESRLIAEGAAAEVLDGRVAFQTDSEDEFTAAVERLTQRRVVAFMSANQTSPRDGLRVVLPRASRRRPARTGDRRVTGAESLSHVDDATLMSRIKDGDVAVRRAVRPARPAGVRRRRRHAGCRDRPGRRRRSGSLPLDLAQQCGLPSRSR
jgi:uncharacterized protein YbcI